MSVPANQEEEVGDEPIVLQYGDGDGAGDNVPLNGKSGEDRVLGMAMEMGWDGV